MSVVVVGAGQAGLATSRELTKAGVDHVVLERGRVAQTWRGRWDSFCLVTPNWFVRLPDGHYDGPDPDGFMAVPEVVDLLEGYASLVAAPVQEHTTVTSVQALDGGYRVSTDDGGDRPHRTATRADWRGQATSTVTLVGLVMMS